MAMTWSDVERAVMARYPQATQTPRSLRFVLARGDRRIGLTLRSSVAYDVPVLVITADLGLLGRLDPSIALELNARLAHGALAVDAGVLVLRACAPLALHTDDSLDHLLRAIGAEAVELDRHIPPRVVRTAVMNHYAD